MDAATRHATAKTRFQRPHPGDIDHSDGEPIFRPAQENPQPQPATTATAVPVASDGHWASNLPCECAPAICEKKRSLSLKIIPYTWLTEMEGDVTIRGETAEALVSTS